MAAYPPNEIVDMIKILGECRNNFSRAERLYAQRYPDRRHPTRVTIKTLTQRASDGSMVRRSRHHEYDVNDNRVITILAKIYLDRHISTRQIEREIGIPQRTVARILKARKFHAYHITLTQHLNFNDYLLRVNFCEWALQMIQQDENFFRYVLFSDEATFSSNGTLNRHNCHYWSDENPHWFRSTNFQNRWSLMVWCGIVNGYLIGPYFFEENVNGQNFLQFLRDDLPVLLEDVDLFTRERMWLQLDGAPAHYSNIVRNYLNNRYNGRWIGRMGAVAWPPRSPDLTSPDFFLWGMLKNIVYSEKPTTKENMKERIRTACAAISQEILLRTVTSFRRRIDLCIQENGRNFEHLIR